MQYSAGLSDEASTLARVRKADPTGSAPTTTTRGLPRQIVARSAQRVGTAALTWGGTYVAAIAVNEYTAHAVGRLPGHGWNLGHTVAIIFVALSAALFAATRRQSFTPERLLDLGLLYEVVGGFLIVVGTSAGMVWDERAHILGLSWICVWIAGFPFIVPATPRRATVTAFVTAMMAPAGLATWHLLTGTPMPEARVWSGITVPALICAGVASIGARIVYGLGRELERARAMGAYRLEERLSSGGMGEIWRARHHMLARPAAVKLVRLDAFKSQASKQSAIARFEREAQLTAGLSSLHTVRLYDFGVTEAGTFYYAMELLDGMDLESLVRLEGPMRPERAAHFLIQVCRSLAEAHAQGLVHRDIKPANLFVCRQGQEYDVLKVLDFGLVRPQDSTSSAMTQLTGEATIVGTPAYMAPETATSGTVSAQSDLYAVGCVGYFLLTGHPVFEGRTAVDVLLRHAHDEPAPLTTRAAFPVPKELNAVIHSCLAKNPADRPQNADALEQMLTAIPFDRPWTRVRAQETWTELAAVRGLVNRG